MRMHPRHAEVGTDAGHLDNAQELEALHARAQDRRAREVQGVFDQADQEYRVRMAKAVITARLLSRSLGKNRLDRLKAQRTPLHRTSLTLSPSRVVNRGGRSALRQPLAGSTMVLQIQRVSFREPTTASASDLTLEYDQY